MPVNSFSGFVIKFSSIRGFNVFMTKPGTSPLWEHQRDTSPKTTRSSPRVGKALRPWSSPYQWPPQWAAHSPVLFSSHDPHTTSRHHPARRTGFGRHAYTGREAAYPVVLCRQPNANRPHTLIRHCVHGNVKGFQCSCSNLALPFIVFQFYLHISSCPFCIFFELKLPGAVLAARRGL